MTESKQQKLAEFKQHFGHRGMDQARVVINAWQSLDEVRWGTLWFDNFRLQAGKLQKLAERYHYDSMSQAAQELNLCLLNCKGGRPPQSNVLEDINAAIVAIADSCSRRNDGGDANAVNANPRKPVCLGLDDAHQAKILQAQLGVFGIPSVAVDSADLLFKAMRYHLPTALIVSTAFDGDGIAAVEKVQTSLSKSVPVFFQTTNIADIHMRLAVTRANGLSLQEGSLNIGFLATQLSHLYSIQVEDPFRVLVVEDSRSQALLTERCLNQAGIITKAILDPMTVLESLDSFAPDAILMDMYMPGCTGLELARVIRQLPRYDTVPILYLSSESDFTKQMDALAQAGDDFLTKPCADEVLITSVRNRCKRHRALNDQMIRDGLTGLLDHNNTLDALESAVQAAHKDQTALCFAMVDIDHFKRVNDSYGHSAGDQVIRNLALFLRQRFRISDPIGRYGGEEFAVVLIGAEINDAERLLTEVCAGFSSLEHAVGDSVIKSTFSCGLAELKSSDTVSSLSIKADQALYQAKDSGRNQVCVYIE